MVGWPLVGETKGEGVVGSCTGCWAGGAAGAGVGAGVMVGVEVAWVAVGGISYFWI